VPNVELVSNKKLAGKNWRKKWREKSFLENEPTRHFRHHLLIRFYRDLLVKPLNFAT
jgi:hypothetical protein